MTDMKKLEVETLVSGQSRLQAPFGAPFGTPFGAPFGTPFGAPFGTPFGAPFGTPFGAPFAGGSEQAGPAT
jgi:hypothetical protein